MDTLELLVDEGRQANAWRFFQLGHDLEEFACISRPFDVDDDKLI